MSTAFPSALILWDQLYVNSRELGSLHPVFAMPTFSISVVVEENVGKGSRLRAHAVRAR